MFIRTYKVKGEDVNDFMVMQNFAYLTYSSKLLGVYLLEKGYSQVMLNSLKIGWQKNNDRLVNKKRLMFTESFSIHLNFSETSMKENKMTVLVDFYNAKNELCATLITELQWFDYNAWEIISPPKKIAQHFLSQKEFRRAV
ncbi:MAG: hypothetical protein JKY02_07010 [Flavobacteriaceae bacterium]|nr:hypothetical protein [Flavobacteriaceae bacterium]